MCFSATASFAAGLSLTILGIASIRKVKEPTQYPFASIPIVFAMQQFVEGIVWLSLTKSGWEGFESMSSIFYLVIAQMIWPVLLPVSFLLLEKEVKRIKILKLLLIPGVIVSTYFLFCLYSCTVQTEVVRHHVFYNMDFPSWLVPFAAAFYLVATVVPPLVSRNKMIQLIGVIILGSYAVARIFFQPSLISVWCFFAVTISLIIYIVMRKNKLAQPTPN